MKRRYKLAGFKLTKAQRKAYEFLARNPKGRIMFKDNDLGTQIVSVRTKKHLHFGSIRPDVLKRMIDKGVLKVDALGGFKLYLPGQVIKQVPGIKAKVIPLSWVQPDIYSQNYQE